MRGGLINEVCNEKRPKKSKGVIYLSLLSPTPLLCIAFVLLPFTLGLVLHFRFQVLLLVAKLASLVVFLKLVILSEIK